MTSTTPFKHRARLGLMALIAAALGVAVVAAGQGTLNAQALTVGAKAPVYALPDQNGQTHTLAQDKGKVVLLAFYPADFTGGCTIEAHSLSTSAKELKAMGVTVYGVSVQDPKSHKAFCEKEGIPYTLLADTQHVMSKAYGVLIPAANVANRVTYIVGRDGKVIYKDTNVNSHLSTCGPDWIAWLKAHPQTKQADLPEGVTRTYTVEDTIYNYSPLIVAPKVAALGKKAPAFSLADVATGNQTALNTLSNGKKATVLLFVATRCPVSNAYNERMITLAKQYAPKGVAFVGIDANQNEPTAECADFVKAKAFPFPWLKDASDMVADAYQAHSTPEAYVVDSKGVLVYHGRIDDNMDAAQASKPDLANALNDVLAGKPVARARTIAFGCSIKRG